MTTTADASLRQVVNQAGATPAIPATYGVTTSDTSGLVEVHGLFGGPGTTRWKSLLPGSRKIIEYAEVLPGAGWGRPMHSAREEVYYIVDGAGTMTINELEAVTVKTGDLIACPAGTIHGLRVPVGAAKPLAYIVVKLPPAIDPPPGIAEVAPMPQRLDWTAGYRGEGHHSDVRVATTDLRKLTATWRRFSLIEIPAGTALGPYDLPFRVSEVLFVTSGAAEITVGNVTAKGETGLFVATPLQARCQIRNLGEQDLYVISIEIGA